MKPRKVIFIVGPTAVGKSKHSVKLARKMGGEIISCDSMQVYKGIDILSCKPSETDTKKIRHYLVDVISPNQDFNVKKFVELSLKLIGEIHNKGKIPIFAGGTGLYVDSLLNGLFEGPPKDTKIRRDLNKKAGKYGISYLYKKLKRIDSASARRIHCHDLRRIIRALEVYKITGKTISKLRKQRRGILQDRKLKIYLFGITKPREELYREINKRVDVMFDRGVVGEVRRVIAKRCSKVFKQALGIREIGLYLKKRLSLKQAKDFLKRNTRRYAKRQMTWFRKNTRIHWLDKGISANVNYMIDSTME